MILYKPIKKRFFIHRLVAIYFVDGYSSELVVNHKDGDKTNNRFENLEWVTRSQNDLHAYKNGLRVPYPSTFRYKIEQYDLISNQTIKVYDNAQECAEELNVQRPNIYACCNGKQKSCRGFGLRYVT